MDCAVAIGEGSTTGLAKAIALDGGLPLLAIPTTYAGSEVAPIWGLTEAGVKRTGRDPRVLPRSVIYDPEVTLNLPLGLSVTGALNAIAHAVGGLYAHDTNPVLTLMAQEGMRASAAAPPRLAADPRDIAARSDALCGAWLCGTVLGGVAIGLHHKLCHALGGSFNLPRAEVHSVVLPQALAYNAAAAPEAMARIAAALGTAEAAQGVRDLAACHGAPTSLRAIGMPASGLDHAADLAAQAAYPNPRPWTARRCGLRCNAPSTACRRRAGCAAQAGGRRGRWWDGFRGCLGTDSSSTMRIRQQRGFRVLKYLDCQRTADRREVFKKDPERVAGLKMFEQDSDGHARVDEDRCAA